MHGTKVDVLFGPPTYMHMLWNAHSHQILHVQTRWDVYYGPFLCIVSFRCYVFCLLVVLPKLSLLAKWLARKTPL